MIGLCFTIGFGMVMPAMEVVESAVTALFVCYAKDASALKLHSPDLYNQVCAVLDLELVLVPAGRADSGAHGSA